MGKSLREEKERRRQYRRVEMKATEAANSMEITLSKKASKELSALDRSTRARIVAGIYKLPSGDVKKLQGYPAAFRLRIGGFRILFEMSASEIRVSDILPRGSAYK